MEDRVGELLAEIGQEYPPCGFLVGDGWFPIVAETLRKMSALKGWRLVQVKQKFCQLRIYLDGYTAELESLIKAAEAVCDRTCERCGQGAEPGRRTGTKLCAECERDDG